MNIFSEGKEVAPGKIFAMLMDNEQRSNWLKQEVHAGHQSESIDRLEKAFEAQSRTLRLQSRQCFRPDPQQNWPAYRPRGARRQFSNKNSRSKISKINKNKRKFNNTGKN
jgi:hypothetical protein